MLDLYKRKGFTLVELLVVISIISILAVIGAVIFKGVTSSARDSTRKADVDAIAKAMEIQFASSVSYQQPQDTNFAGGKKPTLPQGGDYTVLLSSDTSSFRVCAPLEKNSVSTCGSSNGDYCYCISSSQGNFTGGSGSSGYLGHPTSCDPGQSLGVGLAGYWKMDEGTGITVADSSGNALGGTLSGFSSSPWITTGSQCVAGNCLYFDGVNTQVSISNAPLFTPLNNWSVSFWSKIDPSQLSWQGVLTLGNSGNGWGIYASHSASGLPFFYTYSASTGATNMYFYGAALNFNNDWKYYTLIKNGTTYSWYINGAPNSSQDKGAGDVKFNTTSTWVMGISYSGRYKGFLDDIRVYNRILAEPEIIALYNGGNGCIPP